MQQVDFYQLPRPVQERFVECTKGASAPVPLAVSRVLPRKSLRWAALSASGVLLVTLLWTTGFGSLSSGLALHAPFWIAAYALPLAAAVFGALRVLARVRDLRALPFRPATYLFPVGVIDATSQKLKVFRGTELVRKSVPEGAGKLELAFAADVVFTFAIGDAKQAARASAAIEGFSRLPRPGDSEAGLGDLVSLDPLRDIGLANPFVPKTSMLYVVPLWRRRLLPVAVAIGVILAPVVWWTRNGLSDARMLSRAKEAGTAAAYRAYIERGGKRADVAEVLLPRAELRDAEREGTVSAIERYAREHADSQIGGEVQGALRKALLAELETAKVAGTVTAFDDFKARHPDAPLVSGELTQAVHAVYAAAFGRYKTMGPPKDPVVLAFMQRLLSFAELHGPKVTLRFRRKVPPSTERADSQIAKSPFFMGTVSYPSRYFDEGHARTREELVGQAVVQRFSQAFPKDVLTFEVGAPIVDPVAPLPVGPNATLFVEHGADLSAAGYMSRNPRGVFVGAGMIFEATFTIPNDAKPPLKVKTSVWKRPDLNGLVGVESPEEKVYEAMARDAFQQFTKKLVGTFFAGADEG